MVTGALTTGVEAITFVLLGGVDATGAVDVVVVGVGVAEGLGLGCGLSVFLTLTVFSLTTEVSVLVAGGFWCNIPNGLKAITPPPSSISATKPIPIFKADK
jgi:hypothetical protein